MDVSEATALVAAALIGLAVGSFGGVIAARVPSGGDPLRGRSRCDACGRTLGVADLIPVLSWVALGGRCRTCRSRISARWTLLEIATSVLFVVATLVAGDGWEAIMLAPFLAVLLVLSLIDLEHHRLPNAIVYPSAVAATTWIVVAASADALDPIGAAVGAAAYGGGLLAVSIASRGGMGFGDVKLGALIGGIIGSIDLASVAVASGSAVLLGGVAGVIALARGAGRSDMMPFGPMMSAGAAVAVIHGPELADAYLRLLR